MISTDPTGEALREAGYTTDRRSFDEKGVFRFSQDGDLYHLATTNPKEVQAVVDAGGFLIHEQSGEVLLTQTKQPLKERVVEVGTMSLVVLKGVIKAVAYVLGISVAALFLTVILLPVIGVGIVGAFLASPAIMLNERKKASQLGE